MEMYSDAITTVGLGRDSSGAEKDATIQAVMDRRGLSLIAKGLFTLVAEQAGEAVNPFEDLLQPAEVVHRALEELIALNLVARI
ncbi:hypothetical protein [Leucobacter chinensis]|uniref:hypothetical protein n=1 Tax=Leucobacter chinensis TaxID=2851010 RepID=UPI001C23C985|nr:hypothetical protein [Leucobacter chinensis]